MKVVHVPKDRIKGKNKYMKIKGPSFQIQEYPFDKIPEGATYRYKSKTELLNKYKYMGWKYFDETLKLYDEVRKLSSEDISLVTIRDHAKNTLNLVVTNTRYLMKVWSWQSS